MLPTVVVLNAVIVVQAVVVDDHLDMFFGAEGNPENFNFFAKRSFIFKFEFSAKITLFFFFFLSFLL